MDTTKDMIEHDISMKMAMYNVLWMKDNEYKKLVEEFKELNAKDPEGWANSQCKEGINQIGRYVFLKKAWDCVIDNNAIEWLNKKVKYYEKNNHDPFNRFGIAVNNLKKSGCNIDDVLMLIRNVQAEMLVDICDLIDNPQIGKEYPKELSWKLYETKGDFDVPIKSIDGLHESVLDFDPTGKEMIE